MGASSPLLDNFPLTAAEGPGRPTPRSTRLAQESALAVFFICIGGLAKSHPATSERRRRWRRESLAACPLRGKHPLRPEHRVSWHEIHARLADIARPVGETTSFALMHQTCIAFFYSLFPILLVSAAILSLVGDRESTFQLLLNTAAPAAPGDREWPVIEHMLHGTSCSWTVRPGAVGSGR